MWDCSDARMHVPVPLPANKTPLMASKDTDSIQQSYPEYMYTTWKTGRLSGLKITLLAAPSRSASGVMRCSSRLTATAGLRWI